MLAVFLLCAAFALSGATAQSSEEILALLAPFLHGAQNSKQCPAGWSSHGSRCFSFINSPRTWTEAERYCLQFDANLASIHSSQEHSFVQELVKRRTSKFSPAWIGGTDVIQDRLWFWTDGSRFDFEAWSWNQPNNYGGREPCIQINYSTVKGWNDAACANQLPFVCAKRLNC